MSHAKPSFPSDLMVRVETTADEAAYGWVVCTCEHTLTLQVPDNDIDRPGWTLTIPWDQITVLDDVTEFMATGPAWARPEVV